MSNENTTVTAATNLVDLHAVLRAFAVRGADGISDASKSGKLLHSQRKRNCSIYLSSRAKELFEKSK